MKPVNTPAISRVFLRSLLVLCILAGMPLNGVAYSAGGAVRNIHTTYGADASRSVSAGWRTDAAVASPKVKFGPAGSDESTWSETTAASVESAGGFNHHAALDNLKPGTRYNYRVSGPDGSWGPLCSFKTAPEKGGFTFAVIGDVQGKESPTAAWGEAGAWLAARDDVDFAILVGDLVDIGAEQPHWEAFFNPLRPEGGASLFESKTIMPILGNHDYYGGADNKQGVRLYLDQFRLPGNGTPKWDGRFYTFTYGDARFVLFDSEEKDSYLDQTVWLKTLEPGDRPWLIAAQHVPIYQFSRHETSMPGRSVWRPHFFDNHAHLVLTGHNHTLAATHPLRATRLDGFSGGKGFAGPWTARQDIGCGTGLPALLLLEEGDTISYPGLAETGRALSTLSVGTLQRETSLRATRPLEPIVPGEGGDLWIGYLFQRKGGWYLPAHGGWRLADSKDASRFLEISTTRSDSGPGSESQGRFRIAAGPQSANSANPIASEGRDKVPADPFFVLARFSFQGGKVIGRLKTFRAPEALPATEPAEWDAVVESPVDWANAPFDQLVVLGETAKKDSLLDEFRLGRKMEDVLPPAAGSAAPGGALVEELFDVKSTDSEGVVYFDAGGINHNREPEKHWYVRYGQEKSRMPLVSLFTVADEKITGRVVLFREFDGKPAGEVMDEFEIPRKAR